MKILKNKTRTPFGHRFLINESENGNVIPQRTSKIIVENIRRSYEVCKRNGISYYCIFPPSVTFQNSDMLEDLELKWAFNKQSRVIRTVWKEIEAELKAESPHYVIDGRFWMDDYPGCFYDQFHMYENGNNIVSDIIYNYLKHEEII